MVENNLPKTQELASGGTFLARFVQVGVWIAWAIGVLVSPVIVMHAAGLPVGLDPRLMPQDKMTAVAVVWAFYCVASFVVAGAVHTLMSACRAVIRLDLRQSAS